MNAHRHAYIRRIESVWNQMEIEIGLSRQPVGGLCHLAVALLRDEQVRAVLFAVELPTANELRFALIDSAPAEEQCEEQSKGAGESPTEGVLLSLRVLSSTSWYVGDPVFDCIEHVLSGNALEGLQAYLRLLQYVLRDETVRARLGTVVDVALLERLLGEALV